MRRRDASAHSGYVVSVETSKSLSATGVQDEDLVELVRAPGPFISVFLTTDAEIDNAEQRSLQRWKNLRSTLAADGAPESLLDGIDPLVGEAHLYGQCLSVVVSSATRLVEYQPDPPVADRGRWSALPVLGPIIEWRQRSIPHVVLLVDREGADLIGFRREGPDTIRTVDGVDGPISKVAPGGWSQRRYQQRAENTWEHNARNVADALTQLVEQIDARLF